MTAWISVANARKEEAIAPRAEVRGWVRTRRDSKGGFSFIEVNDGSCFGNLQIVAPAELANYESEIQKLSAGCSIVATGELVASPAKGQATEMHATEVRVIGWADPETYPLQKKRHSFEKLREWAHLRPRTNTFGAVARVRNQISQSIHDFYHERGFLYVNTPIITASDCEGAGEMFRVTSLDLEMLAKKGGPVKYEYDFFQKPAYLTVSGQLNGETYATALGRIYTFGPTFRAENSNTSRHLAEFWMVEPEAAFFDLNDNMQLAEDFLKRIFTDCLNHCEEDMAFFDSMIEKGKVDQLKAVVEKPFTHMPYTEAISILESTTEKFDYPISWGTDLQAEHERFLTEKHVGGPVILTDYPSTIKPFYMRVSEDGKTVAAMDVLVPGVGEIIGGSQREERLDVLQSRMDEAGLNQDDYWWYIDTRKYGTVPHAGFGLGLERAVQYATGMANIRDVIPFPRTPGNADF
ncbi:asparagine--tRNA ligase [Rubripirellula amarantea]|uniref:Asparagine--tRNA ligase n=1 Tax=Rubripirellula amarantea TaxID=2527999 RepID=A0A5C5WR96_9BACT|nr:asparagine--tRNA ligase [Rubripirellula amarantea]MDA8745314.1 asparagine--tRNA ligase [Rubripirellula amarantea]TWT52563.1 Asparagine--tRNA ligase [Rubripirellula amarantea]